MWTAPNGNIYLLLGLDTNAVSEVLKHPQIEGKNFLLRYGPKEHAPCFSIITVAELYRKPSVYQLFLDFFSVYSCFILKGGDQLFEDERNAYPNPFQVEGILNAFSSTGSSDSYNLRKMMTTLFSDPKTHQFVQAWDKTQQSTLQAMLTLKPNFTVSKPGANAQDAKRFVQKVGSQQIRNRMGDVHRTQIEPSSMPNIHHFPSLKLALYTTYYRLYDEQRKTEPQDVADILISASVPYLDVFITEKFQAMILREVQNQDNFIKHVEIKTLKDLR